MQTMHGAPLSAPRADDPEENGLNDILASTIRWTLRIVAFAMGLVFFFSLLTAVAILAAVWGLRALWARMTGKPVTPWVMRMNPRDGWSTVYRSTARWTAPKPPGQGARTHADVTDVVARELP